MESESLLLQLGTGLPGRFGATGTRTVPARRPAVGRQLFRTGFFPENLQSVLQSVAERQVRLRLPALPVRSAPRREHDVCQQPLLPAGDVFLGSQRIYVFQMVESQPRRRFPMEHAGRRLGRFRLSAALFGTDGRGDLVRIFPGQSAGKPAALMSTTGRKPSGEAPATKANSRPPS